MKQLLKRAAQTLASKPFIGRFVRIAIALVRLPELNHRYHVFMTQQLPQLLDTMSEINHRQSRLDADQENFARTAPITLRQLTLDVAQLRRELQAAASGGSADFGAPPARNPIPLANGELRVYLGCGGTPKSGYVNVDPRSLPGVDVVANFEALPFEAGTVREFSSSHLLERFSPDQLRRSLLPYFLNLLAPGGRFHTVVSDMDAMMQEYVKGSYPTDELRDAIYGAPAIGHDSRRNIFTPKTLTDLLEAAKFVNVRVLAQGRKNGRDYELEIVAEKDHVNP